MKRKKTSKKLILGITIPLVILLITFSTIFMVRQTVFYLGTGNRGGFELEANQWIPSGDKYNSNMYLSTYEEAPFSDDTKLKFNIGSVSYEGIDLMKCSYGANRVFHPLYTQSGDTRMHCDLDNKDYWDTGGQGFRKCCQGGGFEGWRGVEGRRGQCCYKHYTSTPTDLKVRVAGQIVFDNQNMEVDKLYEVEIGQIINNYCKYGWEYEGVKDCDVPIQFYTTKRGGLNVELDYKVGVNITFPDTDGDGITDNLDACINEKETFNDFEDEDGCPDTPPPDRKCTFKEKEMLAEETFSGGLSGQAISIYSFRYPVVKFCYNHPIIVTDANTRTSEARTTPYSKLSNQETMIIPANQTWTFYYVVEVNEQIPVVCDVDEVLKDGTCQSPSLGIIHICSEGQFDASLGLCVVQPESKVVCEAGRYDVVQNKCIYNPPIQAECPDGSIYNVDLDKCVYTPDLEAVCPEGTTFNPDKLVCEYTPDQINVCLDGYVYNPNTNKCEKTPDSNILCQEGFIYNRDTGKCEAYPDNTIICQIGYTYDPETKKCIKYAETEILCQKEGATFNAEKGYCVLNPPTEFVCEKGILSEDKLSCIYQPDFQIECLNGLYDSELDKCIVTPDTQLNCPSGYTYNSNSGYCERTPDHTLICPQGTYDSEKDACIISPDIQYLCINGIYDEEQKVCVIYPAETIYCRPNFVYDQESEMCVRYPDDVIKCLDDYIYNPTTDKCEKTPETFAKCPEGTGYNQETNKCEYTPSIKINCPPNTQYDSTLKKCVGTTHIIVCNDGYIYNPELHKCVKTGTIAGISYWIWIVGGIILLSFIIIIILLVFKLKKGKKRRRKRRR